MSSFTGDYALPDRTAYSASKFAVNGFFESLKMEMQPNPKVSVTIIGLSRIGTNMRANSTGESKLSDDVDRNPPMPVEQAVDIITEAADARVGKSYAYWSNYLVIYLRPFFPGYFDPRLAAKTRL